MKAILLYTTIFAVLVILLFMIWWVFVAISQINQHSISYDNSAFADKVFLAQIARAEKK